MPIKMDEEDQQRYLKTYDELNKDKSIVKIDSVGKEIMDKIDMNLGELRNFQDKHYEVDIQYEQTRDLYEK